jgi:putative SOS response-associated peptidase YedK
VHELHREEGLALFDAQAVDLPDWPDETYLDYLAPIVRSVEGKRVVAVGTYGLIPKAHMTPGIRLTTMSARSETEAEKRSYAKPWKDGQLCLVPMKTFFEPNYETGNPVRWRIGMADDSDFAVAGIWKEWPRPDGTKSLAFSQLTVNADEHPLMRRFHKPEDEKRSLVIVRPDDFDNFLECRDAEVARSFMQLFPAELMTARPAPKPPRKLKEKTQATLDL